MTSRLRPYIPLYLMLLPGLVYLVINNYIPMMGIVIAFKQYNYQKGILASPFIGFKNFVFLFKTRDAFVITRNTLLYNGAFIVLDTVLAITTAIVLNEVRSLFARKVYQTAVILPFLISMVVVSSLVFAFLSYDTGFINRSFLGDIRRISWYTSPQYWPIILIVVHIWKWLGYNTIIYYATLVGIDRGYYEAAVIDGANRWQQITNITLPCLRPTIIILVLMSIGRIFYSDFGLFYQTTLNSGPLFNVTNTIDTYVYRALITLNNIGMASAGGVYQSFVGFILVVTANWIIKRTSEENSLF